MASKRFSLDIQGSEMGSTTVDMVLRVLSIAMGIAAVALLALEVITVENAIFLLGIGLIASALERLSVS